MTERPRGLCTLLLVGLLAAIYVGYARALDGELQFDDLRGIVENPALRHILPAGQVLELMRRPIRELTDLTLALNYRSSGLSVRPYHLVNLGLHLATVVAVLALALRILRRLGWPAPFATAFFTAAIFGLHPLQTEAVSYVYQRAEVLASLFYTLGLLLALTAEEKGCTTGGAVAYAGALACLLLGWGSKPIVSTFPAALVLCWLAFPAADEKSRLASHAVGRLLASLPFWVLTAALVSLLLTGLRGSVEVGFDLPVMSAGRYFLTQPRVILTYLRLLFWPRGQNVDWEFPPSESLFELRTATAFVAVGAILGCAAWLWWWSARRARAVELRALARLAAFGVLWFFLLLAPTSSIVPILDVMAEHRVYLPSLGILLPVAAGGVLLLRKVAPGPRGAFLGGAAAAVVCAVLGIALDRRNVVWESAIALWSDAVAHSPGKARPHMNLGYALVQTDPERALGELRIAQKLAEAGDRGVLVDELEQNLAGALLALRRYSEAMDVLKQVAARQESAPVVNDLAIAHLESGEVEQARALATRAAERWPLYAPAHHTLGQLDFVQRDYAKALPHFRRAVELDPDSPSSLAGLAMTQQKLGDRAGACASWSRYARTGAPGAEEKSARVLAALDCEGR